MGFLSFLKKAVNPLTPLKAAVGAGKSLAHGDIKGALINSTVGSATMGLGPSGVRRPSGGGVIPPSQEAQNFFDSQSVGDRDSIMRSFGSAPPRIQQWYDNASAAGAVPQTLASDLVSAVTPPVPSPANVPDRQMMRDSIMERARRMRYPQGNVE
jgi:hypothetical protein